MILSNPVVDPVPNKKGCVSNFGLRRCGMGPSTRVTKHIDWLASKNISQVKVW